MKYEAYGHTWNFDDKGGERTLPEPGANCIHCGKMWSTFSSVPLKCEPRPKFTKTPEVAPDDFVGVPEANPPRVRRVIGHEWPEGDDGSVPAETPCNLCGAKFATPDAVNSCTKSITIPIKKIENKEPTPRRVTATLSLMPESEAWVHFASNLARACGDRDLDEKTVAACAQQADMLLTEYRKRFMS